MVQNDIQTVTRSLYIACHCWLNGWENILLGAGLTLRNIRAVFEDSAYRFT
jgi:hypothetical protein